MKKQLLIISISVIIVGVFVSCSASSSSKEISTTAVTDSNCTTHYYEPVADNKGVYAEIETESNGKAVTEKDGTYVTNEHTTVLPINDENEKSSSNKKLTTEQSKKEKPATEKSTLSATNNAADNVVDFEPDKQTEKTKPTVSTTTEKQATTVKETQPATDKDGWITKWY